MYRLEYKEPYIVETEMLKNRTHQSYRWKTVAISEELEDLKSLKAFKTKHTNFEYRILNSDLVEVG